MPNYTPKRHSSGAIQIVFYHKRVKYVISPGMTATPSEWSGEQFRGAKSALRNKVLRNFINLVDTFMEEYRVQRGRYPNPQQVRDKLKGGGSSEFFATYELYLQSVTNRNKAPSKGTIESRISILKRLQRFQDGRQEFIFGRINNRWWSGFIQWLQSSGDKNGNGYAHNTVETTIMRVKAFLGWAYDQQYHDNGASFAKRKVKFKDTDDIAPTLAEVQAIMALDLSGTIERDRDAFIILCFTLLRFSDLKHATLDHIDGDLITIRQKKTGEVVTIPLLPPVRALIRKYGGFPCNPNNSNFNKALKKIGEMAGMTDMVIYKGKAVERWKLLKAHSGRRFGITYLFSLGYTAEEIQQISGHKDTKSLRPYNKTKKEDTARKIGQKWAESIKFKKVE